MKKSSDYTTILDKNPHPETWTNRLLIFTPTRGLIRTEWIQARYGQIIPTNWSYVEFVQGCSAYMPMEYQLADAQNLMAKIVMEHDYEWVLFIEDDNVIPPDTFIKFNDYMNKKKVPSVSGIYWTKSVPPEPILYRGRGNSYYSDWKMGDKVWVDGMPFGCRLEHASLIRAAWKESEEYMVGKALTRRVFQQPQVRFFDQKKGGMASKGGTTDLEWCSRCMKDKLFEKAGWPKFQKMKYPFLVDTTISVGHIDQQGRNFPLGGIPREYIKQPKNGKRRRGKK